jgi:hypothetical protein
VTCGMVAALQIREGRFPAGMTERKAKTVLRREKAFNQS